MPPNQPQPNSPTPAPANDTVWISREEYDRLRTQEMQSATTVQTVAQTNAGEFSTRRRWQIALGGLLALGLFFSVSSGAAANWFMVGAIVVFGLVSLYDYRQRNKLLVAPDTMQQPIKHNPFKVLLIILVCIALLPVIAIFGILLLFMSMGGGDMGS